MPRMGVSLSGFVFYAKIFGIQWVGNSGDLLLGLISSCSLVAVVGGEAMVNGGGERWEE